MKIKTLKKGINNVAIIILGMFAVMLWIFNFIGTEEERKVVELVFTVGFIPACLMYAKFYFCTEKARVKALRKKRNNYKKKRRS